MRYFDEIMIIWGRSRSGSQPVVYAIYETAIFAFQMLIRKLILGSDSKCKPINDFTSEKQAKCTIP